MCRPAPRVVSPSFDSSLQGMWYVVMLHKLLDWIHSIIKKTVSFRQRPSYGNTWKRSFTSTDRPTVHTKPSRQRSFSKTLLKPEEFENANFSVYVRTEHILKTDLFENHDLTCFSWLPECFFSNANPDRWQLRFKNSPGVMCTKNIWCVFKVKPSFSNFFGVVWTGP